MATLILTAVGSAIAGPIGGAIGAIVGQQIDQNVLFKPKGRQGPRLGDLSIQTSSYGQPVPRIYGAMRVAGTVVWATDLKEERRRSGGKGRPTTTTYSYSASFAVALSARPIERVGRIWADGNLLRGAAGDFKSATGFRLYRGGEDQPVDPLIAAAEGIGQTPAFRGLAYAVFEDMALGDFGNRIPLLTFELFADAGPVTIATVIDDLSGGLIEAASVIALGGYAASGDSIRGAIEPLAVLMPLSLRDDGVQLRLNDGNESATAIADGDLLAMEEGSVRTETLPIEQLPVIVAIQHYEPVRDYQTGVQRARRAGPGRIERDLALAAALAAPAAKQAATSYLNRLVTERTTRMIRLGWQHPAIAPGTIVRLGDDRTRWRVGQSMFERGGVTLTLVRQSVVSAVLPAADAGRAVQQADRPHGPTVLRLIELPDLSDSLISAPRMLVFAAGSMPGWRGAPLLLSSDGGASYTAIGPTAAPAVIGTVIAPPGPASAAIVDIAHSIVIELLHPGMTLNDAGDTALWAGDNLALVGEELIQFGRAEPIGANRWQLSRLLRGRRGTEAAITGQIAGAEFTLIEADSARMIDLPPAAIGSTIAVLATGIGDGEAGITATAPVTGAALRPPSPVALRVMPEGDDIVVQWTRRSRIGWAWSDGIDAPLGEESARYRLTITPDAGPMRVIETSIERWTYSAAARAADQAAGATRIVVAAAQLGTWAASRAAQITINLEA